MRKPFSIDNGSIQSIDSFMSIKSDVYFSPTPIYLFEVANELLTTFGIILAVWLLSCTVFLSAFSGVLRGFFIQRTPCKCIDSWEQLYERKDLKIITQDMMYFARFVDKYKHVDEMARDFEQRIEY